MKNKADVIIVGAGIIGASCAYELAKSGRSVIILDRGEPCDGAGGATDGIIALHTKTPGLRLQMGYASAMMFPRLLEELGDRCEYRQNCGGYILCENQEEMDSVAATVEAERADGVDIRMIDGQELHELEPNLDAHVCGAKYARETSIINTFALVYAYLRKDRELGVQICPFTEVVDYLKAGDRVIGVKTGKGEFYAGTVINCTGAWAGLTSRPLGLDIPIQPRRGQIIISEPVAPFVRGAFAAATYIAIKFFPEKQKLLSEKVRRLGNGFGIEQTDAGTLMLASTRELAGFDKGTTLEGIETILSTAVRFMPKLAEMNFIRTFSGFRPACADGMSVLGGVDGLDGYMIVAGHEGDGISLAPLISEMLVQVMDGKPTRFDKTIFSPNRFIRSI